MRVQLYHNYTQKRFLVHRLVAKAFIPNSNNYLQVNHIDENKLNKRSVAIYDSENNYIDTCKSMMDVARKLNCSYSNVQSVLYGRTKTCKGYVLKYTE